MEMKLADYLTKLGTEAKLLHEFKRDPQHALKESGLSGENQELIQKGDAVEIRRALLSESGDPTKVHPAFDWVVVVIIFQQPPKKDE
jgi:hypothetical protein